MRPRAVDHRVPVDHAAAVVRRQTHEPALDFGSERLQLLLPARRELPAAGQLLPQSRRQRAIARLVVVADDPLLAAREVHVRVHTDAVLDDLLRPRGVL